MKAKNNYYFRKKEKKGDKYVMQDVKFDPFNIENEQGQKLGELFERLENRFGEIEKRLDKIDKFIKRIGGKQ